MRQDVIIIIIWKWLKLFSFDSDFCVCLLQSSMNFSHIVMSSSCCIELCRKTINFNFDKLQKVLVSHTHKYSISDISRDDESSLSTLTMAHREKLYHIKAHWWKSEYLIKLTDSTFTHSSKLENGSISSNHTTFSTLHSLCAIPSNRIYFVTMTDIYVRLTMTELRQTSDRLISYTRIDALFPGIFKWRKNLSRSMHDVTHIWHERERGTHVCWPQNPWYLEEHSLKSSTVRVNWFLAFCVIPLSWECRFCQHFEFFSVWGGDSRGSKMLEIDGLTQTTMGITQRVCNTIIWRSKVTKSELRIPISCDVVGKELLVVVCVLNGEIEILSWACSVL